MESHLKIHISSLIWNEGKISLWIVANKLLLNLAKTEFLSTGSGQRLFNLIWESHKKINEIPCLYYEIFRCTYSWKLNGNFPIQYIKKKFLKNILPLALTPYHQTYSVTYFVLCKRFFTYYNALIQRHFDYNVLHH